MSDGADDVREPGFYWVSLGGAEPEVAHYVDGERRLTGSDVPIDEAVLALSDKPLIPPDLFAADETNAAVSVRVSGAD